MRSVCIELPNRARLFLARINHYANLSLIFNLSSPRKPIVGKRKLDTIYVQVRSFLDSSHVGFRDFACRRRVRHDPSISRRLRDFFRSGSIRIILFSIADVSKARLGYDEVSSSRASAIPLISLMSGVSNRALNPLNDRKAL